MALLSDLRDLLLLAGVVTLIVVGILLVWGDSPDLRTGLGLVAFALAAVAVSGSRRLGP